MKNKTARTTMMNRTAGLILVPDDGGGGGGGGVEEGKGELPMSFRHLGLFANQLRSL